MDKIKIIMDTASDITLEEAGEHIELLPVTITVDDKAYRELYDISKEEYWKILEENETLSYLLAEQTKRPVYNRSGRGWGLAQLLFQLKE